MTEDLRYELFDIKQKFLREIPHPKLIRKQIWQIRVKGKLGEKEELPYSEIILNKEEKSRGLEEFLDGYIKAVLMLKHQVSQATDYSSLETVLISLFSGEIKMLKKLQTYLEVSNEYPDGDIKMSAPMDQYQILKRIRELKLNENEIKPYLCKQIEADSNEFDVLTRSCLQANKILMHG